MGVGMKRAREEEPVVSLALSLSTDSPTTSSTTSDNSTGVPAAAARKRTRRGRVVSTSGEGEFVCKTCGRAFETFQALGEHRTSHLRGRHGLELGVGVARAIKERKRQEDQQHDCHICGLGFETGQALGGHMRRHREEMAVRSGSAIDRWVALTDQEARHQDGVLLELFV
ncbi:zinc finger protein ZAT8-like [Triticum aestivum]|uniref:zinc finger protein ZAT8-like n=1 Tax=Triticum aestivum TaxID=4565 RepID=UPI0008447F7A|nr:zinc finger protein ZAT8-like [Triticum aestivum]